jgi:hypothetical protein
MKTIKTFESFIEVNEKGPCWKGYKQVGTKMKDGKEVPNCVPIKESEDIKSQLKPSRRIERL